MERLQRVLEKSQQAIAQAPQASTLASAPQQMDVFTGEVVNYFWRIFADNGGYTVRLRPQNYRFSQTIAVYGIKMRYL